MIYQSLQKRLILVKFKPNQIYHVYNRGNNNQNIFFGDDNYLFFLKKVRLHILKHSKILAYCLMPNHFHFLLYTKSNFVPNGLNKEIAVLLRSYTRAVNNQQRLNGSLFQQKTKAKCLNKSKSTRGSEISNTIDHARACFKYIHQNPVRGGLVSKIEEWRYSSFIDYLGKRNGTLSDIEFTRKLLTIPDVDLFYAFSTEAINKDDLEDIRKWNDI